MKAYDLKILLSKILSTMKENIFSNSMYMKSKKKQNWWQKSEQWYLGEGRSD